MKAISVPKPGDLLWLLIGRGLRGQLCPLGAFRLRSLFLCPSPYPSASLTASPLLASTQVWEWVAWGGIRAAMVVKVMS